VCLWDLQVSEKKPVHVIQTQGENINCAWKHDGSVIAVGNKKELITFIDAEAGRIIDTYQSSIQVWMMVEGFSKFRLMNLCGIMARVFYC
jgi:hypothetical protein